MQIFFFYLIKNEILLRQKKSHSQDTGKQILLKHVIFINCQRFCYHLHFCSLILPAFTNTCLPPSKDSAASISLYTLVQSCCCHF